MDSDDEDLKEAIRLSLLESTDTTSGGTAVSVTKSSKTKTPIITIDDTDDDTNHVTKSGLRREHFTSDKQESASVTQTLDSPASKSSILGLNRVQMEKDRLARLKRASPSNTYDEDERPAKHAKTLLNTATITITKNATPNQKSQSSTVNTPVSTSSSRIITPPSQPLRNQNRSGIRFPKGAVRKTFIAGSERTPEDITLEEVLQRDTLRSAVLSAFQWDFDWLLSKVNIGKTGLIFVMQAKDQATKDLFINNIGCIPKSRLVFPSMDGGVNCMHSKLQLLFHESHLRIAIPSANMRDFDWGEPYGIMENSVFIIDLPRLKESELPGVHTFFSEELLHFCKATGLPADVLAALENSFDFSQTAPYAFVHSIGGSHFGEAALRTGYAGLSRAIQRLGMKTKKRVEVDLITSSLGSLNREFIVNMYRSILGDNMLKRLQEKVNKTKKKNKLQEDNGADTTSSESAEEDDEESHWKRVQTDFRIYFPSRRTVEASKGGTDSGGTICFQEKWYNGTAFPKNLLRDCESARPRMLMHNKMIFVRPSRLLAGKYEGWAYTGSANLSASAWGAMTFDRSSKQPKMSCRNWECGVICPALRAGNTLAHTVTSANRAIPPLDVFESVVPVPMKSPARKIDENNPPWYFAGFD